MTLRQEFVDRLWQGHDPLVGFPEAAYAVDLQGWNSDHPLLHRALEECRPKIVLEVGVWKGTSVIAMAKHMRDLGIEGIILAVDTWLGSSEHWLQAPWHSNLAFEFGYPKLYHRFLANVFQSNLQEYVLPLPLDSVNAAYVVDAKGIRPELIHIDGGHDFRSAMTDLSLWWPILKPGGVLVGDDYDPNWPGVVEAFDKFFSENKHECFDTLFPKVLIRKPD